MLKGFIVVLLFSDAGDIVDAHALSPGGDALGVEVPSGAWHTAVSLEECSVFLEVKPGPFNPITPEDRAPWAPAEGASDAGGYLKKVAAKARRICGI